MIKAASVLGILMGIMTLPGGLILIALGAYGLSIPEEEWKTEEEETVVETAAANASMVAVVLIFGLIAILFFGGAAGAALVMEASENLDNVSQNMRQQQYEDCIGVEHWACDWARDGYYKYGGQ